MTNFRDRQTDTCTHTQIRKDKTYFSPIAREKWPNSVTDRQTDKQTNRQTRRHTQKHKDKTYLSLIAEKNDQIPRLDLLCSDTTHFDQF